MQQVNAAIAAGTWPVAYNTGSLYAWGANASGQLGLNDLVNRSSPTQVGSLVIWQAASISENFSLAVKGDGTLWSWGANTQGQLGLGNTTAYSSPKQVGALTSWAKVSAGRQASFAIKSNGTLWTWGFNSAGQLGLGNTTDYSSPKQVGTLTNWLQISSSYIMAHVSAIKTDGSLWTWGVNNKGQLGLGNLTSYSSPKQVGSLTNWLQVATLYQAVISVKTDGTIWSWGRNNTGNLGLGNTTYYSSPKQIGLLTNWLNVSGGGYYNFATAVKTDGTLWSWGGGNNGQLGLGNTISYSSPKQIGALTSWLKTASGGYSQSLAVKTNGTLWSWGKNNAGQLGLNNTTNYSSPKQVGSSSGWLASSISVGASDAIAII